jgi:hypothetical protein
MDTNQQQPAQRPGQQQQHQLGTEETLRQMASMIEELVAGRRADRDTMRIMEGRLNELAVSSRTTEERVNGLATDLQENLTVSPQTIQGGRTPNTEIPPIVVAPQVQKKALKWPDEFDGNRSKFRGWKQEIEDKLDMDGDLIGPWKAQWYGINQCLGEKPRRVVATFYASGGPQGDHNPEAFLSYLESSYGDPNQASKAATKLRTLKQSDHQTFATFLPTFEQTLAEAGGFSWPDTAKLTMLDSAINDNLRRALVSVDLPDVYSEWVQQVMKVSYKLEALTPRQRTGGRYPAGGSQTQTRAPTPQHDAEGDTKMTGVNQTSTTAKNKNKQRARWVSDEEMRKRRQEGRCYRCGANTHHYGKCPYLPPIKPGVSSASAAKPVPEVEPDLEDEKESESEAEEEGKA